MSASEVVRPSAEDDRPYPSVIDSLRKRLEDVRGQIAGDERELQQAQARIEHRIAAGREQERQLLAAIETLEAS